MRNLYIGIDPGVKTGFAVWNCQKQNFERIDTLTITEAMRMLLEYEVDTVQVCIEDARKRTWFGNTGKERLKGAGSVERDCSIWETFCRENQIPYYLVHPKNNRTKLNAEQFKTTTKWPGRTSEHGRDAAFLVFGK